MIAHRAALCADPVASDDGWERGTFVFNELLRIQFSNSQRQFSVIASGAKQSTATATVTMDCFVAEPVIGRAFARPVGASQ
jgi:hypothetical protein